MRQKYVLITGASRGIGRCTALLFASMGYHVFLNCYHCAEALGEVQQEITALGVGSCETVIGNVGDPADVDTIFQQIYRTCDCLDILVNNAGISQIGLFTDTTAESWNEMIQTNLSSVFYCSKAALPPMIARKSGKIINISSMWGSVGASCEVPYSAAKAGIHGLTKALAKELAPSNIQVNAIACGVIDTSMNSQLSAGERADLEYEIPAGRFGTCSEVAQLVRDIANGPEYMTGQIIGIDGGYI